MGRKTFTSKQPLLQEEEIWVRKKCGSREYAVVFFSTRIPTRSISSSPPPLLLTTSSSWTCCQSSSWSDHRRLRLRNACGFWKHENDDARRVRRLLNGFFSIQQQQRRVFLWTYNNMKRNAASWGFYNIYSMTRDSTEVITPYLPQLLLL